MNDTKLKTEILNNICKLDRDIFYFLLKLEVKFDNSIDTACITMGFEPELLINKEFINKHCETMEHLMMLILHEIYHLILGHTTFNMFGTWIDNIVFDAIINSTLCKKYPDDKYTSFFKKINPSDSFPGCLLRPLAKDTPEEYVPTVYDLYETDSVTYSDLYKLLLNNLKKFDVKGYVLLGNHSGKKLNPKLENLIKSNLPETINTKNYNNADNLELEEGSVKLDKIKNKNVKKLIEFIKRHSSHSKFNEESENYSIENIPITSVIPTIKDRQIYAKNILFKNNLLYKNEYENREKNYTGGDRALVYLDVSGSVEDSLPRIIPVLINMYKKEIKELYCFSTKIWDINISDLKKGRYKTTGGTSINAVFKHYFELPKRKQSKSIIIITDGYFEDVKDEYKKRLIEEKVEFSMVQLGYGFSEDWFFQKASEILDILL